MAEHIAVVGLGYVGLPLAVAFGRRYPTIGYDVSEARVASCRAMTDATGEVSTADLRAATGLEVTTDPHRLATADVLIVAVPTPVDVLHRPDLGPLLAATATVARHMKPGVVVVYESTVYPGATEDVCVPALEAGSGLAWKRDFHVGYSPERINPGDREHTLARITKVVAGDDAATLTRLAALYRTVITAGVHRAPGIRVAEAAKLLENTQRDVNIALVNEFAMVFDRLGIDTAEVLAAAGTKWNFLPFRPGLVGGQCIGVDPYYFTHQAQALGCDPQVVLAGRRVNEGMGDFVAEQAIAHLIRGGVPVPGARVTVLGLTCKEDCAELRNSRVVDVVRALERRGVVVAVHDPVCDAGDALREFGVRLCAWEALPCADAIVVAVAHRAFRERPPGDYLDKVIAGGTFIDVKSILDAGALRARGVVVWRL